MDGKKTTYEQDGEDFKRKINMRNGPVFILLSVFLVFIFTNISYSVDECPKQKDYTFNSNLFISQFNFNLNNFIYRNFLLNLDLKNPFVSVIYPGEFF